MSESHLPKKWERFAKGKKPSMNRRCNQNDYLDRGIYMITLAIEGRRPILGKLIGTTEETAVIELSAFGKKVNECWMSIPHFYPQIEVVKLCIMPDHIHGILFVHERIEKHLGHVINGFKVGTRKAAKDLGILPSQYNKTVAIPQLTKLVGYTLHDVQYTAASPQSHQNVIWERNYNDRILRGRNQYQRMLAYLDDNPRRLLMKRLHPDFLTSLGTITVAGIPMQAMGNRYLLDNPTKIQIQCSRHLYPNEIEQKKTNIIQQALSEGAIIVSPCISPGEQTIATAAMSEGIPLIVLLLKGFSQYFKPQPRYLKACEEGRLLMIAPFPYQNEKIDNMRQRCLQLNDLAAKICE